MVFLFCYSVFLVGISLVFGVSDSLIFFLLLIFRCMVI